MAQKWKDLNMETHFANLEQDHSRLARERVLSDIRTLARDAQDLLKATAGDVGERAKAARARIVSALERANVTYNELQQQTVAAAKAGAKKADLVIRDHPYEAVGVAFGLGILVGVLIGRR
jgi:ElaB/YqjD/DUF883 family membrane-anchored ribosome-binding protein